MLCQEKRHAVALIHKTLEFFRILTKRKIGINFGVWYFGISYDENYSEIAPNCYLVTAKCENTTLYPALRSNLQKRRL